MKCKLLLLALAIAIFVGGCMAHTHTVGAGSKGMGMPVKAKQWYILWGLIPLNNLDSKYLAGEATDYTVRTRFSFVDWLLSLVLNIFPTTIYARSVEVFR